MTPPSIIERQRFLTYLSEHMGGDDSPRNTGLALIDIRNLKHVNHLLGHTFGDRALTLTWQALEALVNVEHSLFRINGNQLAFILADLPNLGFLILAGNRIEASLGTTLETETESVRLQISMGVGYNQQGSHTAESLFNQAELSLLQSKEGHPWQEQDLESLTIETQSWRLEDQFLNALQENALMLYLQPKLHLPSGQVTQAEALLRWQDDKGNFVSPEKLVSTAERLGHSFQLTKWVVHTALRMLKRLRKTGREMNISINVSANLVAHRDLVFMIKDALAIWDVPAESLTVEITESAVMEDKENGQNNLESLSAMGVVLSIDDFGTGYSSLSYFKEVPASELKIDKTFVLNMHRSEEDMNIVELVLNIARRFNFQVTAEGIEAPEVLNLLRVLGCDFAQGHYIARPMPFDDFPEWLEKFHPENL